MAPGLILVWKRLKLSDIIHCNGHFEVFIHGNFSTFQQFMELADIYSNNYMKEDIMKEDIFEQCQDDEIEYIDRHYDFSSNQIIETQKKISKKVVAECFRKIAKGIDALRKEYRKNIESELQRRFVDVMFIPGHLPRIDKTESDFRSCTISKVLIGSPCEFHEGGLRAKPSISWNRRTKRWVSGWNDKVDILQSKVLRRFIFDLSLSDEEESDEEESDEEEHPHFCNVIARSFNSAIGILADKLEKEFVEQIQKYFPEIVRIETGTIF
ncbi:MAG: hypothetical protein Satyrvirus38_5 [Satyrvirus sp.]|uniref:Uncharacterized protein n=1 Tax=Satyrvirus sp. TaxID=2487771 RepID=A0A3G5AF58_9VIRU|nr:MAG: hypothetical protein Satyrvirus38_5 [Satyrvirus sp.]